MIANRVEGDPITDAMWNEIVNRLNGLAPNSGAGIVVLTAPTTVWVVPAGFTTETRFSIWVVGGGGGYNSGTSADGGRSRWAYTRLTGYTEGLSIPVSIGQGGAYDIDGQPTIFNVNQIISGGGYTNGTPGNIGVAPGIGILETSPKSLQFGYGGNPFSSGTGGPGMIVIEW